MDLIAHRGLPLLYPENTEASLKAALKLKPAQIEIDVQRSKDGVYAIFHDFNIKRMTGIDEKLRKLTFSQLRNAPIYFDGEKTDERILNLDELLDIIPNDVVLNVEIKRETEEEYCWEKELVEKILKRRDPDQFVLASLNHECLMHSWEVCHELRLGVATEAMLIDTVSYLKNLPFEAYSYHPCIDYVSKAEVERLHNAGYKVFPWAVDSDSDMEKMIEADVDAVMTNDTGRFIRE